MRLGRILQLIALVDPDLDLAGRDDVEERGGRRLQVLAFGDVDEERRPRRMKSEPFLRQERQV